MIFLTAMDFTLPLADPVLKFLIILLIILGAPLLLNKIRIPPLLGLIIAGAVIGPHGFNLVLRDSSIILSGTAGLLYIMFLAGLEIDMGDFKRNSLRSLTFGLYTFCVPMALGIVAGYYLLGFSWLTSVLLASMFASHTLIAYPIISKLGISKNNAVCITVGGTMITDTLALLVLTIVVALSTGNADDMFWVRLGLSIMAFTLFVLLGFPLIGRWFFKRVHDNISQYIFVLAMVFLGAFLAQLAGLEAIIGSTYTYAPTYIYDKICSSSAAVNGTACALDLNIRSIHLTEDSQTVYITTKNPDNSDIDLYQAGISGNSLQTPTQIASDIDNLQIIGNNAVFWKGSAVFVNGVRIDDDVHSHVAFQDDGSFVYLVGEEDDNSYQLKSYKDGEITTIADDVFDFGFTTGGDLLYLRDYNLNRCVGTLYLYNGKDSTKLDDDVAAIISGKVTAYDCGSEIRFKRPA